MFPKQEFLERLRSVTYRLHRIQCLLREDTPCTHLLHELNVVEKALTSIEKDLICYLVNNSLAVIHDDPFGDHCVKELRTLSALFTVRTNF